MRHGQNWPDRLWLVRHGQSQGNVARDKAHAEGLTTIDLDMRDVDVPLSELGKLQAEATGRWFAALPEAERPEVIVSSPYVRARQTAEAICHAGALSGGPAKSIIDERLREREFGVFDGLTTKGIREKYPEEAEHRRRLGKFYHRAPGGESWADVILRLRSVLNTINLHYADRRVIVVCHPARVGPTRGHPVLAIHPRPPDGRGDLRRRSTRRRTGQIGHRRAAQGARIRCLRWADYQGNSRKIPRGGRASPAAGQILPSRSRRRKLG